MRILLADDHGLVREGLSALLERHGFEVVGEAANGRDVVRLFAEVRPDVLIMDVSMPELNGIDATRQIVAAYPKAKIIGLSMNSDRRQVLAMLTSGASAYLLKDSAAEELIRAVNEVASGHKYVSPTIAGVLIEHLSNSRPSEPPAAPSRAPDSERSLLSQREREVLQLVAEGDSSKEIAAKLAIAVATVETHRRQIAEKLGLRTVAELTKYAVREGITSLD